MPSPQSLSIVIPSHDRADLLRSCLASVIRHAPSKTETIVIDDGSPGELVTRTAAAYAGVRVLRLRRRRGFCAAVNAGIAAAQSDVVELLNDDAEVTANWAETALRVFADPRVAAVAPLVVQRSTAGVMRVDSAGDRYNLGGVAAKRGHGQPLTEELLRPRQVFGASGSSAFYRRDLLLRVGGFPETFGAYFEDVDVAFRLNRAGYRVMFEPASRVYHQVSSSYGKRHRQLLQQQSRNEERVFWRNVPTRNLASALPLHLAVLAGKAWRRWQEGTLAPFLGGRLRVLGEIPALRRHRECLRAFLARNDLSDCEVELTWDAR